MNAIHEAVGWRHVLLLQGIQDRLRDLEACLARRQWTVGWQIVKRECDLLSVGERCECDRGQNKSGAKTHERLLKSAAAQAEEAKEEAGEADLGAKHKAEHGGKRVAHHLHRGQRSVARMSPGDNRRNRDAEADEQQRSAGDEACLKRDVSEPAIETRVLRQETFGNGEDLGCNAKED